MSNKPKLPAVSPSSKKATNINSTNKSPNNRLPSLKNKNINNDDEPLEGSRAAKKAEEAAKVEAIRKRKESEAAGIESTKMSMCDIESHEYRVYYLNQEKIAEDKRLAEIAEELRIRSNGNVNLIYEQYNELFEITNGSLTQQDIDDIYCLSFVMVNCIIHLSKLKPEEIRIRLSDDNDDLYLSEEIEGSGRSSDGGSRKYLGLEKDKTYYVYVIQQEKQLKIDQEKIKKIMSMNNEISGGGNEMSLNVERNDGRGFSCCECKYGSPCIDEYGCDNWSERFVIARNNGWKGDIEG